MVTEPSTLNQGGRPRVFEDDAIFQAVTRVITRVGHVRLTLAAVAEELGSSRQVLLHRFGTKRSLLLAYMTWANAQNVSRFEQVRSGQASPLAALRARLLMPSEERPEEIGDEVGTAHQLGFFMEGLHDESFREVLTEGQMIWEREYARLIEEAVVVGELRPCDPAALAKALFVTAFGAAAIWAGNGQGKLTDQLVWAIDLVLDPWRAT